MEGSHLATHLSLIRSTAALRDEVDTLRASEAHLRAALQHDMDEQTIRAAALADALVRCAEEASTVRRASDTIVLSGSGDGAVSQRLSVADALPPPVAESNPRPGSPDVGLDVDVAGDVAAAGCMASFKPAPRAPPPPSLTGRRRRNDAGDFSSAFVLFLHSYLLQPRVAILLSLANMRLVGWKGRDGMGRDAAPPNTAPPYATLTPHHPNLTHPILSYLSPSHDVSSHPSRPNPPNSTHLTPHHSASTCRTHPNTILFLANPILSDRIPSFLTESHPF